MSDSNAMNFDDAQSPPTGALATLQKIMGELRLTHAAANPVETNTTLAAEDGDQKASENGPKGRLGDIVDRLDERAFGLILLLLALPCCLPFVYLLPQIVALPMLALAGQMALGRHHPWLPGALRNRTFSIPLFEGVLGRAEKYVGFFEKLARPRLTAVTSHVGTRIVGAIMLAPAASILVPLPSTNTVPGIGIAVAALGLVERDGLLVILGLFIGVAWVFLLGFLGLEATSLIKDWISARF